VEERVSKGKVGSRQWQKDFGTLGLWEQKEEEKIKYKFQKTNNE